MLTTKKNSTRLTEDSAMTSILSIIEASSRGLYKYTFFWSFIS